MYLPTNEVGNKKEKITYVIDVISIAKTETDIAQAGAGGNRYSQSKLPIPIAALNLKIQFTEEFPALNYIKCKQ